MSPADHQALVDALIGDEALRLKPYVDSVGKVTIGVGHNLTDRGISQAAAMFILDEDIQLAEHDAQTFSWFADLDPIRQRVIRNMLFNMGLPMFSTFTHLIAAMARKNYLVAAQEGRSSVWFRQVGPRAVRLMNELETGK